MKTNATMPEVRTAFAKKRRAMIGNMAFGPIEAIPDRQTNARISFVRADNGHRISFAKADIGESVFIEYFIP